MHHEAYILLGAAARVKKPRAVSVAAACILAAGRGSVAGTLYIPILVGDAIDQIVGPGQVNFAAVGNLAVKIAVLAGLTAVLQWVMTAIHNRVCFCVTCDVRRQAFSHLQRLPLAYLDSHPSGDTLSRMIATSTSSQTACSWASRSCLPAF